MLVVHRPSYGQRKEATHARHPRWVARWTKAGLMPSVITQRVGTTVGLRPYVPHTDCPHYAARVSAIAKMLSEVLILDCRKVAQGHDRWP